MVDIMAETELIVISTIALLAIILAFYFYYRSREKNTIYTKSVKKGEGSSRSGSRDSSEGSKMDRISKKTQRTIDSTTGSKIDSTVPAVQSKIHSKQTCIEN